MNNFKELLVWQKAVDLSVKIYQSTFKFPNHEIYGLTSQIRRSSVSIPSNVAEGAGRGSIGDFKRFIDISAGSSCELETQIIIANRLDYIENNESESLIDNIQEVQKMMASLKRSLK